MVPWVGLWSVIFAFPDHTHLSFFFLLWYSVLPSRHMASNQRHIDVNDVTLSSILRCFKVVCLQGIRGPGPVVIFHHAQLN